MVPHDAVESNQGMVAKVVHACRTPMLLDVVPAGVDSPYGIANLAADEVLINGLTGAEGDVCLALSEVEVSVTSHKFYR